MTHKELWLEIAEMFGLTRSERVFEHGWGLDGDCICWFLDSKFYPSRTYQNDFSFAFDRDRSVAAQNSSPFWWPLDDEGDTQRCLFACFMAAMSEEDYNEMVEAV